jgi:hypothetical protein
MDAYAKKKKDMIHGQWILEDLGNLQGQKEMAGAPYLHKPVVHVNDATKDVATVINWIKKKKKT